MISYFRILHFQSIWNRGILVFFWSELNVDTIKESYIPKRKNFVLQIMTVQLVISSLCLFSSSCFCMTLGRLSCLALDWVTVATTHHQDNRDHRCAYVGCTGSPPWLFLTGLLFTCHMLRDERRPFHIRRERMFVYMLYQLPWLASLLLRCLCDTLKSSTPAFVGTLLLCCYPRWTLPQKPCWKDKQTCHHAAGERKAIHLTPHLNISLKQPHSNVQVSQLSGSPHITFFTLIYKYLDRNTFSVAFGS